MSLVYTFSGQAPTAPSYTLPEDGDVANATSVNAAFIAAGGNITFLLLMLSSAVNVLNYGADPTGVADSQAAFDDAIAALPAGGGIVLVPPGTYLISAGFSLTTGISFVCSPGTVLKLTSSVPFFRWTGAQTESFVTICNVELDATVPVPIAVIGDGVGVHLLLQNVRIGTSDSGMLSGPALSLGDSNTIFDVVACEFVKGADVSNGVNVGVLSTMRMTRTKLRAIAAQSWANAFVFWSATSKGGIWESVIDFSNNASGGSSYPTGVDIRSGGLTFSDITFLNTGDSSQAGTKAWSWTAGTQVNIGQCSYPAGSLPFGARFLAPNPVNPQAARSSMIAWRGQFRYSDSGSVSSATFNLLDGYDSYVIEDSSASDPTVYLPTPQPGKTLSVCIVNDHAGAIVPVYDDDGDTVYTGSSMSEGQRQTTFWVAVDGFTFDEWSWALVAERTV